MFADSVIKTIIPAPDLRSSLQVFTTTVVVMVLVIISIKLAQLMRQRIALEKALANFPEAPDRHWLLGHLHKITGDKNEKIWGIESMTTPYPKYSIIWIGPFQPVIAAYHHEPTKAVMSTSEPKEDYIFDMLRPWLGDGLLLSTGKKWARNRRLLTPGFHFDVLRPYAKIFQRSANDLVAKWNGILAENEGPVSRDMLTDISLLTLDGLLKCIFSVESNCQAETERNQKHPYIRGVTELAKLVLERVLFLPHHASLFYHLSYNGYKWRRANHLVHSYTKSVVKKRKDALKQTGKGRETERKYVDFLDILLSARDEDGSGLTDQEIQDEVDTFMFEGHDTTSSGMSFFLYNLAIRPKILAKCQKEIDEYFQCKGDDQLDWDDMNKLPYLTMCIKESLRIHSPVPKIVRRLTRDIPFPDGNVAPAGAFFAIAIQGVHHNSTCWHEPELFKPERFSPENIKNIPAYSYVPFSAGPRNCIGQHFAMTEMKITCATLLHNFDFALNSSIPVDVEDAVIMRATKGINLFVKPRKIAE